jgi:hypothetical protein
VDLAEIDYTQGKLSEWINFANDFEKFVTIANRGTLATFLRGLRITE